MRHSVVPDVLASSLPDTTGSLEQLFARFWREREERLFLYLAAAFWILGINDAALGLRMNGGIGVALRPVAFLALLIGVMLKDQELAEDLRSDERDDVI